MTMSRALALAALLAACTPPPPVTPVPASATAPKGLGHPVPEAPRAARLALVGDILASANATPGPEGERVMDVLRSYDQLDVLVLLGDALNRPSAEGWRALAVDASGELVFAPGAAEYGDHSLRSLLAFERFTRRARRELGSALPERALNAEELDGIQPDPLGRWFGFRAGAILFLVLDAELSDAEGFQEELAYVKQVIALAETPRAGVEIRHLLVGMHRSPFSSYAKEEPRARELLGVLATSTKLRAVFSAHARSYERFVLSRTRDGAPLSDVLFGVLGTGGAPTVDPSKKASPPGLSAPSPEGTIDLVLSSKYEDTSQGPPGQRKPIYGYAELSISEAGDLTYQFVPLATGGSPAWRAETCRYGGGLIRWECQ